jgi:hypothetical protein
MEHIIQELIALTYARRDWRGDEDYQAAVQPLEEQLEKKLAGLNLPLEICWDDRLEQYGLFPRDILFPGNSKD